MIGGENLDFSSERGRGFSLARSKVFAGVSQKPESAAERQVRRCFGLRRHPRWNHILDPDGGIIWENPRL